MRKVLLILMSVLLLAGITIAGCAAPTEEVAPTEEAGPTEEAAPQEGVVECIYPSGGPNYPEYAEGFFVEPYIEYLLGKIQMDPALHGKFELKLYPNGMLYNQNDAQAALAAGTVHLAYGGPHFYEEWNPAWKLLEAPGVLDNWEHFLRVMETEAYKDLTADLATKGITILNWAGNCGDVRIFTAEPCETIADLKGLTIRYFGGEGQAKALAATGATGVFLPYTDVVTALQTNQIDGVITDVTGGAFFMELYRYCPNMMPYVLSIQPISNACNTEWHESLPSCTEPFNPGMRESFDRVFAGIRTDGYSDYLEAWAMGAWQQMGCSVAKYDPAVDKELKRLMSEAQASMFAGLDPKYMQAIDSVR